VRKFFTIFLVLLVSASLFAETRLEYQNRIINAEADRVRVAGLPILVLDYYTTYSDSAGGVGISIDFINVSNKRIKYAYFTIVPYNKVDDPETSSVDGESSKTVRYIGYFEPNQRLYPNGRVGNVWYNHDIAYMKITKITLVYDDNSTQIVEGNRVNVSLFHSDEKMDWSLGYR
jgi:hypothetical protein